MARAIVFDFDGVIANSEPLHYRAFEEVLAESGITLSREDYYGRYLGYDDVGVFRAVSADHRLSWAVERMAALVRLKAARMERLEATASILFPGAAAVIDRAAAVAPLAIASGALGAEIRRVLDRERLTRYFTAIVAAEDTPVSKPAADPYLRALALLGAAAPAPLVPADCVAIEDSPWGLESARAAGLRTIAVAHTYPADALQADAIVGTLDQIDAALLDRLTST
jgi:beta-phosphoglucomutase-like phosphatase (HAD superfamily)